MDNTALLAPARRFRELSFGGRPLRRGVRPPSLLGEDARRGPVRRVAVDPLPPGLARGRVRLRPRTRHGALRRGSLGVKGEPIGIKLEDQVLVTEDGHENLTRYPFDAALMGVSSV